MKVIFLSMRGRQKVFGSVSALAESLHADGVPDEDIAPVVEALQARQSYRRDDFAAQVEEVVTWTRRSDDSLPNTVFHGGRTYTVPRKDELDEWAESGIAKSLDGCEVEPNGVCGHGSKSWYIVLGLL